jgi:hypothetical protein
VGRLATTTKFRVGRPAALAHRQVPCGIASNSISTASTRLEEGLGRVRKGFAKSARARRNTVRPPFFSCVSTRK